MIKLNHIFIKIGAPSEKIETEDPNAWSRLEDCDRNSYIMTCACGQDDMKVENLERLGLVPDHAYSLIGVRTIQHPREGKTKLCEIRNPWGWSSEEWNGKWSDSWKGWNDIPEVKKSLDLGKDDGRFLMLFEDFKTYFDYVTVCKMNDDYYFTSYPIRTNQTSYSIRTFHLDKTGTFSLTLTQKDERYFRSSKTINYHYTVGRLVLAQKIDDEYEFLDGVSDECKNLTLTAENMEAGDYCVIISIDPLDDKRIFDCVLSYYGSQDIEFERIRYKDCNNMLEKIMVNGGKGRILMSDKKGNMQYTCYLCLEEGFLVESYSNGQNKEVLVNKDYSKNDKRKYVVLREDQSNKFKIKVGPMETISICSKIMNIFEEIDGKALNELK